jgi:lipid-binding SYLF domain-containing protein
MRRVKFTFTMLLAAVPLLAAADAQKTGERLRDAAGMFQEIMTAPDSAIPQELLSRASCVVLLPGLKKGALMGGGKYGKGFVVCRAPEQGWGPPAAVRVEGGSFGFQVGFSMSDVVLLIMNQRGMDRLMQSKFTIGGEAAAALGPVGRNATAQTDGWMTAEILSWSRSHGIFAGVSLDGSTLRTDIDGNEALYGKRWNTRDVLRGGATPPQAATALIDALTKFSMRKTN